MNGLFCFQTDADLIRKEILAFEAKRKFFEKENESVSPSKADTAEVNRNGQSRSFWSVMVRGV